MKSFVFLMVLAVSGAAFAQSFSLRDNVTGRVYKCSPGVQEPSIDLGQCTKSVSEICSNGGVITAYCLDKAIGACKANAQDPNFESCVGTIAKHCSNGSSVTSYCLDKPISSCKMYFQVYVEGTFGSL